MGQSSGGHSANPRRGRGRGHGHGHVGDPRCQSRPRPLEAIPLRTAYKPAHNYQVKTPELPTFGNFSTYVFLNALSVCLGLITFWYFHFYVFIGVLLKGVVGSCLLSKDDLLTPNIGLIF